MKENRILFRVDGNASIGLGHVYRAIALAEMLKGEFSSTFIFRESTDVTPVRDAHFKIEFLPMELTLLQEPEYLNSKFSKESIIILDGYNFDEQYQKKIKSHGFSLVYIDDMANFTQKADLVINHSPGIMESDYKRESYTKLAMGLKYAILRNPFLNFDRSTKRVNKDINNVLVSFGGADSNDFTFRVVKQLVSIDRVKRISVILGSSYDNEMIYSLQPDKIEIHRNLSERGMFAVMNASDIAIVPASTISIELASLGVPMVLGYYVDNQKGIYNGFVNANAVIGLGDFFENIDAIGSSLESIQGLQMYSDKLMGMFVGRSKENIICAIKRIC